MASSPLAPIQLEMPVAPLPPSAFSELDLPSDCVDALTLTSQPLPSPAAPVPAPSSSETAFYPAISFTDASAFSPKPPLNTTSISLYAEHLLHIRTVTLSASLRTARTQQTRALLSADGCEVSVGHEGEVARLKLPVRVRLKASGEHGSAEAALMLPGKPEGKEINLRLSAEDEGGLLANTGRGTVDRVGNWAPWGAAALNKTEQKNGEVNFVCKSCERPVLQEGRIGEWRDLPNENWAEMMEFWHCHRPDHEHEQHSNGKDGGKSKGYAAANQLKAISGVGFVDLGAFLLKEEDCEGIEVSLSSGSQARKISCQACKAQLGEVDDRAEGFRIWKWSLATAHSTTESHDSGTCPNPDSNLIPKHEFSKYSIQKWVSAHFLSLIENQAIRKFCVGPDDDAQKSEMEKLMIWVFTPDLTFSSSISSTSTSPSVVAHRDPTRAMKVFYQILTPTSSGSQDDHTSFSVEEVRFPSFVLEELKRALVNSGMLMPETARMFKTWHVGLLERFEGDEEGS